MKIYQNVYNSLEVEDFKNLKIVVLCLTILESEEPNSPGPSLSNP
jgi:hypothetical protein